MSKSKLQEMDEEEFEKRVQAIREFDLTPVTERLRYKKGYENAEELEKKFRRFAKLILEEPDREMAPTEDLDEYWHTFILDTRRYKKFCDEVFGTYLHHTPGDPRERDPDSYKERIESGEVHEADAFCHSRLDQEEQ